MKLLARLVAHVECWLYLLTRGMWRGERKFTLSCRGECIYIAATTGTIKDLKITRVFYEDVDTEVEAV